MSLCIEGLSSRLNGGEVTVFVQDKEPLIQLGNLIDWEHLKNLAEPDLKKTRGSFWWLGRKLYVRIHLAVMILQALYKWTDRETEIQIKTTPVYQIFCGLLIVVKWHCPDHTKIETFRNRLSPETYLKIIDYILNLAVGLGLGNPKHVDIDSTVQEANISYPSDATLMKKLSLKSSKVFGLLTKETDIWRRERRDQYREDYQEIPVIYFLAKNVSKEKKQRIFVTPHTLNRSLSF